MRLSPRRPQPWTGSGPAPLLRTSMPRGAAVGDRTAHGVHYVLAADGSGGLTPVAETEFARDRAFGFGSSRLAEYVEEKSGGAIQAAEVTA